VQVDPINPTLKALGTKRLKLKYDGLLSSFAFNFVLRRYTSGDALVQRSDSSMGNTGINRPRSRQASINHSDPSAGIPVGAMDVDHTAPQPRSSTSEPRATSPIADVADRGNSNPKPQPTPVSRWGQLKANTFQEGLKAERAMTSPWDINPWAGLTLVHFSTQPELFLTQNPPSTPPDTPWHPLTPPKHFLRTL